MKSLDNLTNTQYFNLNNVQQPLFVYGINQAIDYSKNIKNNYCYPYNFQNYNIPLQAYHMNAVIKILQLNKVPFVNGVGKKVECNNKNNPNEDLEHWKMLAESCNKFRFFETEAGYLEKIAKLKKDAQCWQNAANAYSAIGMNRKSTDCLFEKAKITDKPVDWQTVADCLWLNDDNTDGQTPKSDYNNLRTLKYSLYCLYQKAKKTGNSEDWIALADGQMSIAQLTGDPKYLKRAAKAYGKGCYYKKKAECLKEIATLTKEKADWKKVEECQRQIKGLAEW